MTNRNLDHEYEPHHEGSECSEYSPLISAMIDGELESNEQMELLAHVERCENCERQVRMFEELDAAVATLSKPDRLNGHPSGPLGSAIAPTRPVKLKPTQKSWTRSVYRIVPIAAAATLLVCLAITAIPIAKPVNADEISQQWVEPLKDLQFINIQQQRDQDLMLRTLDMDLRSLKIDTSRLEPGSSERLSLELKINAMIDKVNRFETDTYSNQ